VLDDAALNESDDVLARDREDVARLSDGRLGKVPVGSEPLVLGKGLARESADINGVDRVKVGADQSAHGRTIGIEPTLCHEQNLGKGVWAAGCASAREGLRADLMMVVPNSPSCASQPSQDQREKRGGSKHLAHLADECEGKSVGKRQADQDGYNERPRRRHSPGIVTVRCASARKDTLTGARRAESWDLPELWEERATLLHV